MFSFNDFRYPSDFIFMFGNCQDRNRSKIHHRADGHGNLRAFPPKKNSGLIEGEESLNKA